MSDIIDHLIQAALDVLHHDTDDGDAIDKYEREVLRKRFSAILKPRVVAWRCRWKSEQDWKYDEKPCSPKDRACEEPGFEEQALLLANTMTKPQALLPGEMASAIRAWLECPVEKRPSPEALGQRIVDIAKSLAGADPRGPFFSTQWEREDYERRQRGEPELGPRGTP